MPQEGNQQPEGRRFADKQGPESGGRVPESGGQVSKRMRTKAGARAAGRQTRWRRCRVSSPPPRGGIRGRKRPEDVGLGSAACAAKVAQGGRGGSEAFLTTVLRRGGKAVGVPSAKLRPLVNPIRPGVESPHPPASHFRDTRDRREPHLHDSRFAASARGFPEISCRFLRAKSLAPQSPGSVAGAPPHGPSATERPKVRGSASDGRAGPGSQGGNRTLPARCQVSLPPTATCSDLEPAAPGRSYDRDLPAALSFARPVAGTYLRRTSGGNNRRKVPGTGSRGSVRQKLLI